MTKKDLFNFKDTSQIDVPKRLIDQVIGQDKAVEIVKKAARQRRNVLLIGPPGTGKSMLAQGMAEIMPSEDLEDILVYPNSIDENAPLIRVVKTYPSYKEIKEKYSHYYSEKEKNIIKDLEEKGQKDKIPLIIKDGLGRRIVSKKKTIVEEKDYSNLLIPVSILIILGALLYGGFDKDIKGLIIGAVFVIGFLYLMSRFINGFSKKTQPEIKPKLIVDNSGRIKAPFIDATGAKAGALLGDVKHDPLQSGGLGTPAHLRVDAGALQKANKGVLFIDEIATLKMEWQQEILTAMQEKRHSITGQSDLSSGAMVKTKPCPTDFVLVAAGNLPDIKKIHPALRSRISGNGYEVYVEDSMPDTPENRLKMAKFVAQEVKKDGKIPHFSKEAVLEIIEEAKRRSGKKNRITLNLREIGGLIRAAGDLAKERNKKLVEVEDIRDAKKIFESLEEQVTKKIVEHKKMYQIFTTKGQKIGVVNGLAVIGRNAGIVLPIMAEVTPASSKHEGKVIATGKLGTIAKEAVKNVSAIIKKYLGKTIADKDIHIQFLQTYEGVEGDSASISIAVAVISALENIGVKQDYAMTGSLSVRGDILPVGGVTAKIEAAIEAGIKKIIIPKSNEQDVYISKDKLKSIKIIKAEHIADVLKEVLKEGKAKKTLLKKIKC